METLLLIANLVITWRVLALNGASPNSIASIYVSGCLLSLYILTGLELSKEMLFFTAMPINDYEETALSVYAVYTLINLISYAVSPRKRAAAGRAERSAAASVKLASLRMPVSIEAALLAIFTLLSVVNIAHFMSMDYSTLLSNDLYLTVKTPEAIGIRNDLMAVYHKLIRFIGASAVIVLCESLYQRRHAVSLVTALYLAYCILIMATGASRWICVYAALAAGFVLIRKPPGYRAIATALIAVTFFCFVFVLLGRSSGAYGLSHLGTYMDAFSFEMMPTYISGVAVNVFEGAFNLANSLQLDATFDPWYVRHSFLPLFSFMDGFNENVPQFAWKFAPNVPMSAISETYLFGPSFFMAYIAMYATSLRLSVMVYQRSEVPFILKMALMAPMYYVVLAQHTYSLRTIIKPSLLIIVVFIIVLVSFKRKNSQDEPNHP